MADKRFHDWVALTRKNSGFVFQHEGPRAEVMAFARECFDKYDTSPIRELLLLGEVGYEKTRGGHYGLGAGIPQHVFYEARWNCACEGKR
jgi:hypothetical protein